MSATLPAPAPSPDAPQDVRPTKRRMLIIVNPYATTVSDRLKSLVVYALQGRYDVEAVSTEAQNHAIEIGREAIDGGYDIVVAFGGDGTLNEVANGLAGTDIPVSVLPGGSTNVVARTFGHPQRRRRRDRAPARVRRPLRAPADRPRHRQREAVRLRLRRRPRRDRGRAGRLPPPPEAPLRPLLLHLGRGARLLRPLPARPGADARRVRGGRERGGHRDLSELGPLHLLPRHRGPGLRGGRDRLGDALARGPEAGRAARRALRRRPGPGLSIRGGRPQPDRPFRGARRGSDRVRLTRRERILAALPGPGRRRLHRRARRARARRSIRARFASSA